MISQAKGWPALEEELEGTLQGTAQVRPIDDGYPRRRKWAPNAKRVPRQFLLQLPYINFRKDS